MPTENEIALALSGAPFEDPGGRLPNTYQATMKTPTTFVLPDHYDANVLEAASVLPGARVGWKTVTFLTSATWNGTAVVTTSQTEIVAYQRDLQAGDKVTVLFADADIDNAVIVGRKA